MRPGTVHLPDRPTDRRPIDDRSTTDGHGGCQLTDHTLVSGSVGVLAVDLYGTTLQRWGRATGFEVRGSSEDEGGEGTTGSDDRG